MDCVMSVLQLIQAFLWCFLKESAPGGVNPGVSDASSLSYQIRDERNTPCWRRLGLYRKDRPRMTTAIVGLTDKRAGKSEGHWESKNICLSLPSCKNEQAL